MNALTHFIPLESEYNLDDSPFDISDPWSKVAIDARAATAAAATHMHTERTDHLVPHVYETMYRLRQLKSSMIGLAPDAGVASFNLQSDDAVASAPPEFLLTRTAPPIRRPRGNTSVVVAEWEGYVTRIDADFIEARLTGLSGQGVAGEIEEATIPNAEIADTDPLLVAVGGLFRLCVSYEKSPTGERRRYSTIVFRRLPAYRQGDLDAAHERTRQRLNALRVE